MRGLMFPPALIWRGLCRSRQCGSTAANRNGRADAEPHCAEFPLSLCIWRGAAHRSSNYHRLPAHGGIPRMDDVRERFQNLHEFLKVARFKLNRNNWDYVVGGTETETTLARNRQSLDRIAFKPRVLRNVQNVDCSTELYGRKIRLPVMIAPVGGLQNFWAGGAATVAAAAGEFGIPMLLSSATEPGPEGVAKEAPDAYKIFQLYARGDDKYIDDFYNRSQAAGFVPQFCFTVDLA